MKKHFKYFQFLALLCTMLTACQAQEKSRTSESPAAPRADSILTFNSMITAILEDSKGNIWFGSYCDGFCKYDPSKKASGKPYFYYTVEQGLPKGSTNFFFDRDVQLGNSIRDIQEDKAGNIWFYTAAGYSKYDGKTFTPIQPEPTSILITESFDFSMVSFEADWNRQWEKLWFIEASKNGCYRLDGDKLTHLTFPIRPSSLNSNFDLSATYSLYKDQNKNIWLGTEGAGIFRYDGNSFFCLNEDEKKGIVRAFFQDKDGIVWVSNVTQGLYTYDHEAYHAGQPYWTNFTKAKGFFTMSEVRSGASLDSAKMLDGIQSIAQDEEGNMWFGTFEDGLWQYDGEIFTHFTEENGFISNTVKMIQKDKSGRLLFGIGKYLTHIYYFNGVSFERIDK